MYISEMDLLAQMATFVRVVEGKSLSAAARAQGLSLPAVSRQLRALELDLGANLVVRSTRKLHITDAGRQWYEHCVRVLREIEDARADVRSTKTVRGTIVVSASLTFGSFFVLPHLRKLVEKHPHLTVDLRLEDQLIDLVGEGVDVALRAGSPPPDSTAFVAHPLFSMQRVLVAAPRWLKRNGTPRDPSKLARFTDCLVQVTPAGTIVRWALVRGAPERGEDDEDDRDDDDKREQTVEVRGRVRTNAPLALRDLAIDGLGIAFLPEWLVASDLKANRLRRILPKWTSAPITAWAIYRAELRGSPRLRAFIEAMPKDGTAIA